MAKEEEWEQVGTVWRKKPQKTDYSWIGGLAVVVFILYAIFAGK